MVKMTLHFIFLDLRKAYDTVNRKRLLEIIERYGVGPNILGLLKFYWDKQHCVVKYGKYHREIFVPYRGATQGSVVFTTLFNVLVNAVVREWLTDVTGNITAAIVGLQGDDVGRMSLLFYANDGAIRSKDHEWLQNLTQYLFDLFRDCTGLKPNTKKTETMSCYLWVIQGRSWMEGYKRRHKGTGDTYSKRKGKELRILFLFVTKTWHWDPYNITYVRNMEWMLPIQLSPNQ